MSLPTYVEGLVNTCATIYPYLVGGRDGFMSFPRVLVLSKTQKLNLAHWVHFLRLSCLNFTFAPMLLGKAWIHLFYSQLCVNMRADSSFTLVLIRVRILQGERKLWIQTNCVKKKKKKRVKLPTVVKGNQKAPFSIATTLNCRGGCYSFPWIAPLYPWYIPYIVEC